MIRDALNKKFIISGHRGYCAKYPENTLLSFQAAIELGVDMLELDLHLSADGIPMLMHDNLLDRTSNGSGLLREKTCAELKTLDPYKHLVTTSTSQMASLYKIDPALFGLPEIDFAQVHDYGNQLLKEDFTTRLPTLYAGANADGKPVPFAELGVDSRGAAETLAAAPAFSGLHDLIWLPFFIGAAGGGMTWWWDNVIDPKDQYGQWAPFAAFSAGLKPENEAFAAVSLPASHPSATLQTYALRGTATTLVWVKNAADNYLSGGNADEIAGAQLDLSALPRGSYTVLFTNPYGANPADGQAQAPGSLKLPAFRHDLALKLTPTESTAAN